MSDPQFINPDVDDVMPPIGATTVAGAEAAPAPKANVAPWWWPTMRDVLAILSTALLAGDLAAKYWLAGHPAQTAGLSTAIEQYSGAIILQWGSIMTYYFGTSKSSAAKDATIAAQAGVAPAAPAAKS